MADDVLLPGETISAEGIVRTSEPMGDGWDTTYIDNPPPFLIRAVVNEILAHPKWEYSVPIDILPLSVDRALENKLGIYDWGNSNLVSKILMTKDDDEIFVSILFPDTTEANLFVDESGLQDKVHRMGSSGDLWIDLPRQKLIEMAEMNFEPKVYLLQWATP